MVFFPGQQLGNYAVTRLLGEGNFARVYLGEHIYLNTPAAIKILNAQVEHDQEFFRTEARTIARLTHPHIVRVLDFGVEDEVPFLVLDYAPGGTLRQRYPRGTLLAVPTLVSYTRQVAEALQYAHNERVVHRDVKPENLLLGRNDDVLLSDFGVALMLPGLRSIQQQEVAGTPAYIAPEQIQQQPGPASDQYALAIVVYEWLTGALPFSGSFSEILAGHISTTPPPPRAIRPAISLAIEQVVMKALEKDPGQRYPSVLAFAEALEQASLTGAPPLRQALLPTLAASAAALASRTSLSGANESRAAGRLPLAATPPSAFSGPPGALVSTYQGHTRAVGSLCWMADGQHILSTSNDPLLHIWDAFSGTRLQCYQDASETVRCAAGSADGTQIATAGADALVRVWDVASNRLLTTYNGHRGQNIHALAWAPTQPLLATAADGTVHVWECATGQVRAIYRGHTGNVNSLAWSPDASASPRGHCIVSGGDDTTVQTWEALSTRALATYSGSSARVLRVAWSPNVYASRLSLSAPNSSRVACGRENGTVQMWDTQTRREVLSYRYAAATSVVAWSPDGLRFACATAASMVEVWDINTNAKLVTFAHSAPPLVMAWSPDGAYIASGGGDASIQVWRAP
ncbi:MAG TPA: serine/threonine-protein kinase [Ktedonobacteraceae bacterium]